jgi:hypothetical protein
VAAFPAGGRLWVTVTDPLRTPVLAHGLCRRFAAQPARALGVTTQHAVLLSNLVAVNGRRVTSEIGFFHATCTTKSVCETTHAVLQRISSSGDALVLLSLDSTPITTGLFGASPCTSS